MITLVLGGVRSGKSELAEQLAGAGPVTYVATGVPTDEDFADRVARHRGRRPPNWSTIEESRAVPQVLARLHGPVLLDALGTWIANDPRADITHLVRSLQTRHGDTVVVSEEVGLGVHAPTEVGRLFADRLGEANRQVAEVADRCLLVVAGRVIELPSPPAPSASEAGPATGRGRGPTTTASGTASALPSLSSLPSAAPSLPAPAPSPGSRWWAGSSGWPWGPSGGGRTACSGPSPPPPSSSSPISP